jgi:hypothetical protein
MPSKTEAMCFPQPMRFYPDADTSRLDILDNLEEPFWLHWFTDGIQIPSFDRPLHLTTDADVDKRIGSAWAALLGLIKTFWPTNTLILKFKVKYIELFLSILLYGCEIRCLRDDLFNRLRPFNHRCARAMCRITFDHSIRHRFSSASLVQRLAIEPFDTYYNRRLLRWTGHVAWMPLTRAPRKILTCWVDNSRPRGCPQLNWGRALK